jgi:hypothetical protein
MPARSVIAYIYRNRNPYRRPCAECRRWIGHTFKPGTQPHLPRHEHCYCYYEVVYAPVSHPGPPGEFETSEPTPEPPPERIFGMS